MTSQITYQDLPSKRVFDKDSGEPPGKESPLLRRVRQLLDENEKNKSGTAEEMKTQRRIILSNLYFASNAALKMMEKEKNKPKSQAATSAVFSSVCLNLSKDLGITVNVLPDWIEKTFGRQINTTSINKDIAAEKQGRLKYLNQPEADKYLISFEAGVAKRVKWVNAKADKINLETTDPDIAPGGGKAWAESHAGYALSMGGDFYAAKHQEGSFFHSAYKSGDTVLCAGSWKVKNGEVKEISNASGHYRPTNDHLVSALEMLKSLGVDISGVKVMMLQGMEGGKPIFHSLLATNFLSEHPKKSYAERAKEFNEVKSERIHFLNELAKQRDKSHQDKIMRDRHEVVTMVAHRRTKSHFKNAPGPQGHKESDKCEAKSCYVCRKADNALSNVARRLALSNAENDQILAALEDENDKRTYEEIVFNKTPTAAPNNPQAKRAPFSWARDAGVNLDKVTTVLDEDRWTVERSGPRS